MRGFHVISCQFLKAIRGKVNRLHPTFSVIDHDSRKEELSRLEFSFVLEEGNYFSCSNAVAALTFY